MSKQEELPSEWAEKHIRIEDIQKTFTFKLNEIYSLLPDDKRYLPIPSIRPPLTREDWDEWIKSKMNRGSSMVKGTDYPALAQHSWGNELLLRIDDLEPIDPY